VVNHHLSAITVDAGDANVCTSSHQVPLSATVTVAGGVEWSGGNGTFSPSNTDLSPTYTLSPEEVSDMETVLNVTTTDNGGCPSSSDQLSITLSPEPIVDAGTDGMVCQTALQIPLNGQIVGDSDQGEWSTMGNGTFSSVNDLGATYYPSPADTALGYVNLILSSIANGVCSPVRDTITIEFGNLPSPNFNFTKPACAGEPIHFSDNTVVSWGVVQEYDWDFGGIGTSAVRHPSYVFADPGTYNVTLRTVTDQGCEAQITKEVIVSTDPSADFSYTPACYGNGIAFENQSVDGVSWFWDFGNGFISTLEAPSGILYESDGFFDATLIAANASGCRDTVTKPVEVLPRPVADFQVDNICAGTDVTFTDNSSISNGSILSWKWDFGNGKTSDVQNPMQSFSTSNPINVKLRVESDFCADSVIRQVTPLETPSFIASPTNGCSPLTVNFYNSVQPNVYYNWDFGDGYTSSQANPVHIFLNETTEEKLFDVVLHARSIFGCHDSATAQMLVYPQSISEFSVDAQSVCSNQSVQFTNESVNAVNYFWDFGSEYGIVAALNPSQTFTNTTDKTQYFPVKLITSSSYGCTDTAVRYITSYPLPNSQLDINTAEGCHPLSVRMQTEEGATTYKWSYGDGTSEIGSNEMVHVFENISSLDKAFNLSLEVTSSDNCKSTIDTIITVNPSPVAEFSIDNHEGCAPVPVKILNTSKGVSSYSWDYGDGNADSHSSALFDYTFDNTSDAQQSYIVNLAVESPNGCTDAYSESVIVYPKLEASFTAPRLESCSPFIISFDNTSYGAHSYAWKANGDVFSTNANASNSFINEGTDAELYDIKLVASSVYGCVDESDITTLRVNPRPVADFDIDMPSGCSPFDLQIDNNTSGATSYNWEFSNGENTEGNISSYLFENTSTEIDKITMNLIANNSYNCPDTSIQTVTVFPEVTANFSAFPLSGCSPLDVEFNNSSSASASRFKWDFGDGKEATISEPDHTFEASSVVSLTAITDYGCESTETKNIEVFQTPAPDFALSSTYLHLPESTVLVDNKTDGDWVYNWYFGDGTFLRNVTDPEPHDFQNAGEYTVELIAYGSNGCQDTVSQTVVIVEAYILVDYDSSYAGCSPVKATFTNKSENAEWYSWDFGDGTVSSEENPSHLYEVPGTYVVELRAGNGTSVQVSRKHTVVVYPIPEAGFTVAPAEVYLPDADVNFYNQSENGDTFKWVFGDGNADEAFETSHQYTEEGVYDVYLHVESEMGCSDSLWQVGAVTVKQKCDLLFPNAFTPAENEISGVYQPDIPEVTNDIFHPVYENIIEYNLQIFDRWGELVFESNDVNEGWNGFYKGVLSKQDTYVWQVEATCLGGRRISDSGSVTLMR